MLTTNGFGGSKNDQRGMARLLAGYVVLSYSGLGFGGSGARSPSTPRYDGRAASQLISYLGGADGIGVSTTRPTSAQPHR